MSIDSMEENICPQTSELSGIHVPNNSPTKKRSRANPTSDILNPVSVFVPLYSCLTPLQRNISPTKQRSLLLMQQKGQEEKTYDRIKERLRAQGKYFGAYRGTSRLPIMVGGRGSIWFGAEE